MLIKAFAFFVILLIPVGIPGVFAFLMVRAKRSLGGVVNETATGGAKLSSDDVEEEADAYGFLTRDYRPECYFYEIVTYSKKLVLGGVAVMVGRGTLAQTYFVITAEAFFLMHHMRTFPFVNYKHNVIDALGHQALMLMYAITLILRNDNDDIWRDEWFPQEGYGWFICFLCIFVLPSPTVYFYYKEQRVTNGTDDSFEENPLSTESDQSDVFDAGDPSTAIAPPARAKLAKMQREAKDTRAQIQKMQKQLQTNATEKEDKDNEIYSLKAIATAKDESTKVQALQAKIVTLEAQVARPQMELHDVSDGSGEAPHQAVTTSSAVMKELATDETLSEETRESAKQALGELANAQILESKNAALERELDEGKNATLRKLAIQGDSVRKLAMHGIVVSEDMTKYLQGLRLLHHADAVINVVGM